MRFAETDAQGVAHNSNYLVWFEVARVAYLAEHAGGYSAIRDQGVESFVLESHVRYLQPAHFDDHLIIHARVGELRGARFRFEYEITRSDEVIADGWTSHACVDAKTLRKHYRDELDTGQVKASARVAESLYRRATTEGSQSSSW